MIYFYKVTNLLTGTVYDGQATDVDEFSSYRDFIANLESLNSLWSGEYKFEESSPKRTLTSEYEMV